MNIFFWATIPLCWWKSNFTSSAVYTEPTIMQIVWYTTVHSIPLNHLKFLVVNWELPPERKWCLLQSSAYASAVFITQISAYLAKARCQLVMHIPCTHLREIRRWEELVPVSFTPPLSPPSSSSSSSSRSADVVGPLRAHLLCCRSFGPAGAWLGARWLGFQPRQSTQVSHGFNTLTGPIKERQETGVRPNTSCEAPSGAKSGGGFTRI